MSKLNGQFKIRDPIHGFIYFSQTEKAIIDNPYFQRLRRLHQLAVNELIFPGANHTRFSHCLGVMHLASKYAEHLFPDDPQTIKIARLAGLLHDIGHGPFSHTWDDTIYKKIYSQSKGHDQHRLRIIKETDLAQLIKDCGVEPDEILAVWSGEKQLLHAIVQGVLGADRMDYLLRDSYYLGTRQFGTIEYERIINESRIENCILHYNVKLQNDIFHALKGRAYMYENFYYHKTNMSANIVIKEIIKYYENSLIERTKDLSQFVDLDETFIYQISKDDPAYYWVQRFKNRQLPKLVKEFKEVINNKWLYIERTEPLIAIDKEQFSKDNIKFWSSENKQSLDLEQLANYEHNDDKKIITRYYQ